MSSQAQVRELFSLPKKEIIFDDFGCSYASGILYQGRMYLTENYICFYSSIMGLTKKIIIPLNDVTKIIKAKRLGMKSIKISSSGKTTAYKFSSFTDSDKTYKIIHKLWGNVSPNAQQDTLSSEEEEANENNNGGTDSANQSHSKENAHRDTNISSSHKKSGSDANNDLQPAASGGNHGPLKSQKSLMVPDTRTLSMKEPKKQNKLENSFEVVEELKKEEDFQAVVIDDSQGKQRVGSEKKQSASEQQVKENSENVSGQQEKPQGLYEKAQSPNEILKEPVVSKETNVADTITKEELERLMESYYPLAEGQEELVKICINMGAMEVYNQMFVGGGAHNLEKFYIDRNEQKLNFQEWKAPEIPEEYDGKPVVIASQMFAEFQVKDNPFVKVSPTTKYYKVLELSETKLHMKVLSKTTSVPYCDTFAVEEEWLAVSPAPGANCCVLRLVMQMIWYKSTIFRSKIASNAFKASSQYYLDYMEWVKKRNIVFKEKKQQGVGKLKHGIEKSNKLFEKVHQNEVQQVQVLSMQKKIVGIYRQCLTQIDKFRIEILLAIVILYLMGVYFKQCSLEKQILLLQEQLLQNSRQFNIPQKDDHFN